MSLKNIQKSAIGSVLTEEGFRIEDFKIEEDEKVTRFTFNNEESWYFAISLNSSLEQFNIGYTPNATSLEPILQRNLAWNRVLIHVQLWAKYIEEELKSTDPWSNEEISEEFADDPELLFTPAELETIDEAVDASFEKLIAEAKANGIEKKLDDVLLEIKQLKKLARSTPKGEWLKIFKEVIAAKLVEWGLDIAIGSGVLAILYEVAKPVLKIVAGT